MKVWLEARSHRAKLPSVRPGRSVGRTGVGVPMRECAAGFEVRASATSLGEGREVEASAAQARDDVSCYGASA
eukprot:scaffold7831_cov108-Isochrysis_galbana.AAC.11